MGETRDKALASRHESRPRAGGQGARRRRRRRCRGARRGGQAGVDAKEFRRGGGATSSSPAGRAGVEPGESRAAGLASERGSPPTRNRASIEPDTGACPAGARAQRDPALRPRAGLSGRREGRMRPLFRARWAPDQCPRRNSIVAAQRIGRATIPAAAGATFSGAYGRRSARTTSRSSPPASPSTSCSPSFPAITAFVSLFGLIADPDQVQAQFANLKGIIPDDAWSILNDQLTAVASARPGKPRHQCPGRSGDRPVERRRRRACHDDGAQHRLPRAREAELPVASTRPPSSSRSASRSWASSRWA